MNELLMILRETGEHRNGYPVFEPHPEPCQWTALLTRGFSGRLLRLYAMLQTFLQGVDGRTPEPAYLLLSNNDGGFARTGFYLGDEDKRQTSYVDLTQTQALVGKFGAMDQIFPHELGHVILLQLTGERPAGGANQVHAISVRTDPVLAFDEGFAEHLQVMSVDDLDADPSTQALTLDTAAHQTMRDKLEQYRTEICAGPLEASKMATTFPYWFSQVEQLERYHGVKENLFSYEPSIPEELLQGSDPYRAYLLENAVPGFPGDPPRSPARAVSVEGFVSTFFHRFVHCDCFRNSWQEADFYAQYGVQAEQLSPLDNVYLKTFYAIHQGQALTLERFAHSYAACFADEAADLQELLSVLLHGQKLDPVASIWLANPRFTTGTSLFDQHRVAPRTHTFDLNAASIVDLITVPGMSQELALSILRLLPVDTLSDLCHLPGMTDEVYDAMVQMAEAMQGVQATPQETERSLMETLYAILNSYR